MIQGDLLLEEEAWFVMRPASVRRSPFDRTCSQLVFEGSRQRTGHDGHMNQPPMYVCLTASEWTRRRSFASRGQKRGKRGYCLRQKETERNGSPPTIEADRRDFLALHDDMLYWPRTRQTELVVMMKEKMMTIRRAFPGTPPTRFPGRSRVVDGR